jgi:hypothetical protein
MKRDDAMKRSCSNCSQKSNSILEVAIDQEDGEKVAKSLRHHVEDGVCESLDPFLFVLCQVLGHG